MDTERLGVISDRRWSMVVRRQIHFDTAPSELTRCGKKTTMKMDSPNSGVIGKVRP